MQFIQARRLGNKLGMKDNLPLAIDDIIFLRNGGFLLNLSRCDGIAIRLSYTDLDWFREDFNIVNSINELEEYRELNEGDEKK